MTSSPPTAFPLFPQLPSELRLKIWTSCLPPPRNIPIRFSRTHNTYHSSLRAPVLAHISSESRALFLQHYHLLTFSPAYASVIYANLREDTLLFDTLDCSPGGDLAADLARSEFRDKIERVAVESQLWEVLRVFRFDCLSEIKVLGGLRCLALVLVRGGSEDGEGSGERERDREEGEGIPEMLPFGVAVERTSVEYAIRHVNWCVWALRWEIENAEEGIWKEGKPGVQLWLW